MPRFSLQSNYYYLLPMLFSRGGGLFFWTHCNSRIRTIGICVRHLIPICFSVYKKKYTNYNYDKQKKKKTLADQLVPAAYRDGRYPHGYNIILENSVFFGRAL